MLNLRTKYKSNKSDILAKDRCKLNRNLHVSEILQKNSPTTITNQV